MLDRVRIRTLRDAGHTLEEIAATVGVAKRSVQNILKEPPIRSPESAPTPASRGVGRPSTVEAYLGHVERILKTHLAVSIAHRAIQNGYDARFTTAAQLIDELSAAARDGELGEALTPYLQPHVLVIDEVGYLTYSADAANVLFQVVDHRYLHKKPMLFTTNKPLSQWGRVLHDPDLAEAITDRVLERGRFIQLRGPSYRTRHLKGADNGGSQLCS